jgi:diguanylate cyclase
VSKSQIETDLRGPQAFDLARRTLEQMQAAGVWPTPLNFELWLHYLGDPAGSLGQEIGRLVAERQPFSEQTAEDLAARYLSRSRISDEIRDAGAVLNRELSTVSQAIADAQSSQRAYGETLAAASGQIETAEAGGSLASVVRSLSAATEKVRDENAALERRLEDSVQEVSRLREHLEQVRRDAMTDALTNLANRKAFDEALERACVEAGQSGAPLTLAVLDIDHFKRFNDTWGHQTGDQVIRYVASVLGRMGAAPRLAARYGGEEFALIFPGEAPDAVCAALNEVREEIASRQLRRRSTNHELGTITVSAGLAHWRTDESPTALIERADQALYASKKRGRNCVTDARLLDDQQAA